MSVQADLLRFGARRYFEVEEAIAPFRVKDIGERLLVALGTRETNLTNVVSHSGGRDRGVFQINVDYHRAALERLPGCPSGAWTPEPGRNAAEDGYVPTLHDGAVVAYMILVNGHKYALNTLGLRGGAAIRFALAAYNAGVGGAQSGQQQGDPDKFTTGSNYSSDVLYNRWRDGVNKIVPELGWF